MMPANGSKKQKYYPKDREGNYDEWAAVFKTQHETATRAHKKMEQAKRQMMAAEYGKGQYEAGLAKVQMEQ